MEPVDVLYRYFDCIDRQDPMAAVQNFTEDARAEVMTGKFLDGRDRIGRALGRILDAYARTSHHVTNERVEMDGENAILTTYVYAYHRMKATGGTWHLWARLVDVMVPHGESWLIKEHRLTGLDAIPSRREIPDDWYGGHHGKEWDPIPHPSAMAARAIEVSNPGPAHGLQMIRDAAAGLLDPGLAGMIAAAAAAAKNQPVVLRESLERALAGGFPKEQAWATPAVVLISRGQAVSERLAEALIEVYGEPDPGPAFDGTFDKDATLAYFQKYFDGIPPRIQLLADRSQQAFEGYTLMHRLGLREGALPPVSVELILCGINGSEFQTEFVKIHADAARRMGATEDQLFGALLSIIPIAGAAAWPGAATALLS